MASRLGAAMRRSATEFFGSLWVMTRFGCCVVVFKDYVAEVTVCVGPSMLPSFNKGGGDIVVCEHLTTRFGEVQRGDVVIANSPSNPRQTVCKRVLGLGGDVIMVPYVDSLGNIRERQETVPRHHVWLQGDNTRNSNDSRHYGPLPVSMLQSRVCYRIWPPREVGPIRAEPERCHVVALGAAPQLLPRAAALPREPPERWGVLEDGGGERGAPGRTER